MRSKMESKSKEGDFMYPQDFRKPCEVISYYKDGKVYPLRFRVYSVENATYYVYDVEKIDYVLEEHCNGLTEKTFFVRVKRKRLKERHMLYLDPRYKRWWILR